MTPLEDSYKKFAEHGFILIPTRNDSKFPMGSGSYAERKAKPFNKNRTGYAAIVPPNIISVDIDVSDGKVGMESYEQLLKDLDLDYVPEPTTLTQSGGLHIFFENKMPSKIIGSEVAKTYKHLDIYAGYQTVHPIPQTKYRKDEESEFKMYDWANFEEEVVINPWSDKLAEVLHLVERGENTNNFMNRDPLEQVVITNDMPDEQVDEYLEMIDPNKLDWDSWIEVGMTLYDRYAGAEEGRERWVTWSQRSKLCDPELPRYVDPSEKWNSGGLVPRNITYKRLRNMASEYANDFANDLKNAKTPDELDVVIEQISKTQRVQTRSKTDSTMREEFANIASKKLKEFKKEHPSVVASKPSTIMERMVHQPTSEELAKDETLGEQMLELSVFILNNRYAILYKGILYEDITVTFLEKTRHAIGIAKKVFEVGVKEAIVIAGIKEETNYMIEEALEYKVWQSGGLDEPPYLHVLKNPLAGVVDKPERQDIIDDFFNGVWNGKAEEIIRIIGLTMRFKETKLNKIHVVAPSNTGKTTFLENIGFQTIHMKRFLPALNGDKGIGKTVIDGLKKSGFLLLDETNNPLTQEIKNIDNYVQLDQFGQGGTQEIKLHFTCMTSTHKTAVRGMSDEMYNRLLLIELHRDEMDHILTDSDLFLNDNLAYTETVQQYGKWVLKDALINPKYSIDTLRKLQGKHRLELNSDVDDMLIEISETIIDEYKSLATMGGDVLERNGEYFIKRKTDLVESIESRMSEYSHIDKGKYGDELIIHFLGKEETKKSIKVDGKPLKYYQLNLKKYYPSEEAEILDAFEDLDQLDFE